MVKIYKDETALSRAAADYFLESAQTSVKEKGRFSVVLSGGGSPHKCYELLKEDYYKNQIPWDKVFVFWGDERFVPRTDDRNNAKMAFDVLLNHVPIPEKNIFPIPIASTPRESASEYEKTLRIFFADKDPVFDLIFLGLGENGHTASLFPKTSVIDKQKLWVSEVYIDELKMYRITLTSPVINMARQIMFLVFGDSKAEIVSSVLTGPYQPRIWPAQLIKPVGGEIKWLLDEGAASIYQTKNADNQ